MAQRSFRDIADQDYIAARICYRQELTVQFVWMAEQAIEKYLKSILLFNNKSAKNHSHAPKDILKEVEKIEGMKLDLSCDVLNFINYIHDQGENRYLSKPHYTKGDELYLLDKSTWEIRRYCQYINQKRPIEAHESDCKALMEANIRAIHELKHTRCPHKFKIPGGYLEKLLEEKKHPQKDSLIWQNLYYGNKYKSKVRIPRIMRSINPPHFVHPERINEFNEVVRIPGPIKKHLQSDNQRSRRKKT